MSRVERQRAGRAGASRWRPRHRTERGETLAESLCTIVIVALGVVALVTAMGDNFHFTRQSRNTTIADSLIVTFEENLQGLAYEPCSAGVTPYSATVASAYPTGFPSVTVGGPGSATTSQQYAASITTIAYWNGSSSPAGFATTCPSPDPGVQQLTISMASGDGVITRQLTFVKRKP